jgi:CheY-like chemotaxis protein
MSTVYAIVKRSAGEILVSSQPGQGATISIYLPRVEDLPEPPQEPSPPVRHERGTETILLVEDEDAVRRLVHDVLSQHGYVVLQASHPEEALEHSQRHTGRIDLLLTDIVMPGMSGRELADRLAPARSDMKVLFISGYTEDAALVNCPQAALLKKPFTPAALADKVRTILDNRS